MFPNFASYSTPPLQPLVPLLLAKSLVSASSHFFSAHGLGVKVMSHMTLISMAVLAYIMLA